MTPPASAPTEHLAETGVAQSSRLELAGGGHCELISTPGLPDVWIMSDGHGRVCAVDLTALEESWAARTLMRASKEA